MVYCIGVGFFVVDEVVADDPLVVVLGVVLADLDGAAEVMVVVGAIDAAAGSLAIGGIVPLQMAALLLIAALQVDMGALYDGDQISGVGFEECHIDFEDRCAIVGAEDTDAFDEGVLVQFEVAPARARPFAQRGRLEAVIL